MSVVYSRRMNVNIYYVLATLQEAKQGANPESELIQFSLSWGGDRELITPLIVTQTYMRTVIPRWVTAVEGAAPHLLQIPTLTRWDKQNSKLMKPFLSWFSGASPSGLWLDFYILWDFIQKISFTISFFGKPFLHIMSWGEALQTCGTHYSLFPWPKNTACSWYRTELTLVFMTHQDGKIKRNTVEGVWNYSEFFLLLFFSLSLAL